MPDQIQGTTVKMETGEASPDHSHTFEDITAKAIAICIEAALDHNTGIDAATTEAAHDNLTQPTEDTATDLTMTHHTDHMQIVPT